MHALNRLVVLFCASVHCALAMAPVAAGDIDFNRDIKPILSAHCYACHGPDAAQREGGGVDGLRLDTHAGAREDLGGFAAISPGDASDSELIVRVMAEDDDGLRMPPSDVGRRLEDDEIEMLRRWIDAGAEYAEHWSYVPPQRPHLPEVSHGDWPRTGPDHFVLARLEQQGMSPAAEADRFTLARRLFLDLTGLPPTPEEVAAFVGDPHPQAYERLVDELISRAAYGEHWARLWLDLARYADSAGYADDPPRTIWLYRDWVIDAINANMPLDQFTIEQMAGDLLDDPSDAQLIATAFHRNTMTNNEGGTEDEEFRNAAVVDRVNTTFAVWMGTTMACAQCHTHKYDPISQEEYFQVFAILNNTADADRRDEAPLHHVHTPEQQRRLQSLRAELDEIESRLTTLTPQLADARDAWIADFPHDLTWQVLRPTAAQSRDGTLLKIDGDQLVATEPRDQDSYRVTLALDGFADDDRPLGAIQITALADDALPGGGPGHAGGNFVITGISATWTPPAADDVDGQFVRISIPGKKKILSLAEVEVFSGQDNVAIGGAASQSSTDFGGPAELAIDGNTDGRYAEARSTTHTAISDDPWWEVDLGQLHAIDRLVLWNRTDQGTVERLKDFSVEILDAQRQVVWRQQVSEPPRPSVELSPGGARSLPLVAAFADDRQQGFAEHQLLEDSEAKSADGKSKGWAVGGAVGQSHRLILAVDAGGEIPSGSELTLTIDQDSQHAGHVLGRFRVSVTDDPRFETWARTPPEVLAALQLDQSRRSDAQRQAITDHFLSVTQELAPSRQRAERVRDQIEAIKPVSVPIMQELSGDQRRGTRLQHRGNFLDTGDPVQPGVPAVFHPLAEDGEPDRLALARWLVDPANPLTARVIANRYWEQLFGIALVATSEEFGSQGELPSHPQLLDWLATELVRLDWDSKAFIKMLVMSASYRQSSRIDTEALQRDPDNRLIWRGPRFRMAAEVIRDQALAIGGLLSDKMHGPPVNPPQPSIGLKAAFGSGIDWTTSEGADRYRRGLYTSWRRSNPYPSMATFDAPNREVCTLRRDRSNTPLQALVTLNDPVFVEAAQGLARRMLGQVDGDDAERAAYGLRLCLARPPAGGEVESLLSLLQDAREALADHPDQAARLATEPLGPPPQQLAGAAGHVDLVELAAWTALANVLLNLDETLMRP